MMQTARAVGLYRGFVNEAGFRKDKFRGRVRRGQVGSCADGWQEGLTSGYCDDIIGLGMEERKSTTLTCLNILA
jgi:hypothetical protein